MTAKWLAVVLRLHPQRFRELMENEIRDHFGQLGRAERRRMLLDLSRNLPGVYVDQIRLRRALGGSRGASARAMTYRRDKRPEAPMLELLHRDLRLATRRLVRTPVISVAAALTLALGIGGTTAIFSLINGIYLDPLSAPAPAELIHVHEVTAEGRRLPLSYETYLDYKEQAEGIEDLAVMRSQSVNVTGGGESPERIRGLFVSASFFEALGESPVLGRGLRPAETEPGGEHATVISHGFWQRRFGGELDIIGQTLELNNIKHTIVGVMGPSFRFPVDTTEAWISLQTSPGRLNRTNRSWLAFGRLHDGIASQEVRAELQSIAQGLAEAFPESHQNISATAVPLIDIFVGPRTRSLFEILLAAVTTVLLIGAANVANLQLAQATGRAREMALRMAVGASRLRLFGQLLIENLVLALLGGVLGIGIAYLGVYLLANHGPGWIGSLYAVQPDLRVLVFSLVITMSTGFLLGLLPARRAGHGDLTRDLKDGGRGSGPNRASGRIRSGLVIAQSALAVMLVICAALLMRSFSNLKEIDVGFQNDGLMTVQFRLPTNKYESDESVVTFFERLIDHVEGLPGVEAAATAVGMPFTGDEGAVPILADGIDPGPDVALPIVGVNSVSAGYFATMGIPRLTGRVFERSDRDGALPVVVLSLEAANAIWPEAESVVGRTLRLEGDEQDWTVIGLVGDIYNSDLRQGVDPMLYLPHAQDPFRFATLAARVSGKPVDYGPALRQAIWDLDANQPVWEIMSQNQRIAGRLGSQLFATSLVTIFAATALLLAAIGIGGVVAYAVVLRRRELGIRLSLGASQLRIMGHVIGQGLALVGIGLLVGLFGAMLLQRMLSSFLFGVEALDPWSFSLAPGILLAVALLATLVPAWRAADIDPVRTLREE